jgi:hypothetical protein
MKIMEGYHMKLALSLICIVLLIIGATQGTLLQNQKPGNINVDLGDGYKLSFTLPNTVNAYDIETDSGYSDLLKSHDYNVYVYPAGNEDSFLEIRLTKESQPTHYFIHGAGREDLKIEGIGPYVYIPQAIDGANGYVVYTYPEGNSATEINEANGGAFRFYPTATAPKATPDGSDVEGIYEVKVDTYGSTHPQTVSVFKSILDSIHLLGV